MNDARWTRQNDDRYTAFDGRLYLERRPKKSANWHWRCCHAGGQVSKSTKTDVLRDAQVEAERQFTSLLYRAEHGEPVNEPTFRKAWQSFIDHHEHVLLAIGDSNPLKIRNYKSSWRGVEKFLGAVPVSQIASPKILAFQAWRMQESKRTLTKKRRRASTLTVKTMHNYFIVIRQVLRHAVLQGWLKYLPEFPELHIKHDHPDWFEQDQLETLLSTSLARVNDPKLLKNNAGSCIRFKRLTLHAFIWLMAHGCIRVDECLKLRWCDLKPHPENAKVPVEKRQWLMRINETSHGKTGYRQGIGTFGVETALGYLRELYPKAQPNDWLFPSERRPGKPRKSFDRSMKTLLEAADNLRLDSKGKERTSKTLRHTSIMLRYIHEPTIRLHEFSIICGVSPATLANYYLKHITARHVSDRLMRQAIAEHHDVELKPTSNVAYSWGTEGWGSEGVTLTLPGASADPASNQ